jgi:drug/metabolite transporter (DMT)-like permease
VAACLAAALSYALYILVAELAVATRDPISLSCYGFFFASLFWATVQPWWSFPHAVVARTTSLLWLGESLGLFQLLGGGLVLTAIALAQSSR